MINFFLVLFEEFGKLFKLQYTVIYYFGAIVYDITLNTKQTGEI
jgi:hypothetical protein